METVESMAAFYEWMGIIFSVVILGAILFGLYLLIRLGFKIGKKHNKSALIFYFTMLASALAMVASWIMNLGWLRVILTWVPIPLIHFILYIILNSKALAKMHLSNALKLWTAFCQITFMFTYFMLPDFGDTDGGHVFFGQITDAEFVDMSFTICALFLIAHIICVVCQIVTMCKIKPVQTPEQTAVSAPEQE